MLVAAVLVYAALTGIPAREVLPFALILLVASVPVALPATFTVATALGSRELARPGRAGDPPLRQSRRRAGWTSSAATRPAPSPATRWWSRGSTPLRPTPTRTCSGWRPSPATSPRRIPSTWPSWPRRGSAEWGPCRELTSASSPSTPPPSVPRRGSRTPARPVACQGRAAGGAPGGPGRDRPPCAPPWRSWRTRGSAFWPWPPRPPRGRRSWSDSSAWQDPPRDDSAALVRTLGRLGVRVIMVTGDGASTAAAVARQVGLGTRVARADALRGGDPRAYLAYDVFARVLPGGQVSPGPGSCSGRGTSRA